MESWAEMFFFFPAENKIGKMNSFSNIEEATFYTEKMLYWEID